MSGEVGYRAVLFDLFDTLVLFDRTRLPVVRVNGRAVHTTAGRLHAVLQAEAPGVELAAFLDALLWSWQEAERLRAVDDREIPATARFRMLFERLGLDPDGLPPALLPAVLRAHREELSRAMEFPAHHRALLERLAARHRLAVVSNFDYTPTVDAILDRSGVAGLFQTVVISDAVGWRKPKPIIFEETLRRLEVSPRDALFVGDRPDIDVLGARRVAMDVAWVNRTEEPLPAGIPAPQFEIRDLAELEAIVGD